MSTLDSNGPTLMFQLLVGMVVPTALAPKANLKSLQASEASTYTKTIIAVLNNEVLEAQPGHLLCSPVLRPQITEGALPPGLVTEKESVKHWPLVETALALPGLLTSWLNNPASPATLAVLGPAMLKVWKSNLIWQTLLSHLHTFRLQLPAVAALTVK